VTDELRIPQGKLVLIGSGELSDSMAEVHRTLMAQLGEPPRPVFVDTLAGFELNIDSIDHKAVSYFRRNFGLELALARYRTLNDSAERISQSVSAVQKANYIFAGPGSPSYGIRTWRDSRVWEAILERWRAGAMLVFASAAAITSGAYAIPVYEIYKVGESPSWIPGLNLMSAISINAAVVPHWNNNSGDQHDTRFCFMGAPRLALLEEQLPAEARMIGVDEYTALLIDGQAHRADVYGNGAVTIRSKGYQTVFTKGQSIDFDHLTMSTQTSLELDNQSPEASEDEDDPIDLEVERAREAAAQALTAGDIHTAAENLYTLGLIAGTGLEQGLLVRTEAAVRALQTTLPLLRSIQPNGEASFDTERAALLEMLISARAELRKAKQWAAADDLRNRLTALQYVLSDTPQGTTWQRM